MSNYSGVMVDKDDFHELLSTINNSATNQACNTQSLHPDEALADCYCLLFTWFKHQAHHSPAEALEVDIRQLRSVGLTILQDKKAQSWIVGRLE